MKGTTEVTYLVLVEPAADQLSGMAIWLLERDPGIRTASPSSFHVPAELFKDLPEELLVGAFVDGHVYRSVIEGFEPLGRDGYRPADVVPVDDGARPEAVPLTEVRLPVKRRARKASSRQVPTGGTVSE